MTTPIQKPNVELKKFQFAEFASEETNCYSAEVWVNGMPAFHAKNDGHGGCDHYSPINNSTGLALVEAYVKTLPPEASEYVKDQLFPITVEGFINDIVEDKLREKDIAKQMKKMKDRILVISNGKLMSSGKCDLSKTNAEAMVKWAKGDTVINLLTPDKQLKVLTQFVKGEPLSV